MLPASWCPVHMSVDPLSLGITSQNLFAHLPACRSPPLIKNSLEAPRKVYNDVFLKVNYSSLGGRKDCVGSVYSDRYAAPRSSRLRDLFAGYIQLLQVILLVACNIFQRDLCVFKATNWLAQFGDETCPLTSQPKMLLPTISQGSWKVQQTKIFSLLILYLCTYYSVINYYLSPLSNYRIIYCN